MRGGATENKKGTGMQKVVKYLQSTQGTLAVFLSNMGPPGGGANIALQPP